MANLGKGDKVVSATNAIIPSFTTGVKKSSFTQKLSLRIMGSHF